MIRVCLYILYNTITICLYTTTVWIRRRDWSNHMPVPHLVPYLICDCTLPER